MTSTAPEILADRAFSVYDEKGEQAMISFLVDNRDTGTEYEDPYKMGIFPLSDGSLIEIPPEENTYLNPHRWETRPKELGGSRIPPFPMRAAAVLDWPNSETIRYRAVQRAAQEAMDELREEYEKQGLDPDSAPMVEDLYIDTLMDTAEALAAAPGLDQAIRKSMEEPPYFRDDVLEFLDALEAEHAQDALHGLPEGQRHDLVQAAKEKIKSEAEA
jgi:hypothetical protein